jgi:metal-responsive CopG/Arc/MetJ family transcriptional regulator
MSYKHPKNEILSLGIHPNLLRLIDIAANNEFKTRSFFIREALSKALIARGAISNLEQHAEFQKILRDLCGDEIAPGSSVIGG